jgi:general secretion pathway protein H
MRTRGFSLIEVMLVLVIIALSYTLLPRLAFTGVTGAELRSNVRAVAAGLRLTRDAAINKRRESSMKLDLENREFTVAEDAQIHKLNEKLDVKLYTSQADLITDKVGAIRFYPDGSSNGGRITVGSGGRNFDVDVDWLTGHVTISEVPAGESRA